MAVRLPLILLVAEYDGQQSMHVNSRQRTCTSFCPAPVASSPMLRAMLLMSISAYSAWHVVRLCNANLKKIITQEGQLQGGFSHGFSTACAFLLALCFRLDTSCLLVQVQGSAQLASPAHQQPQISCTTCIWTQTHTGGTHTACFPVC